MECFIGRNIMFKLWNWNGEKEFMERFSMRFIAWLWWEYAIWLRHKHRNVFIHIRFVPLFLRSALCVVLRVHVSENASARKRALNKCVSHCLCFLLFSFFRLLCIWTQFNGVFVDTSHISLIATDDKISLDSARFVWIEVRKLLVFFSADFFIASKYYHLLHFFGWVLFLSTFLYRFVDTFGFLSTVRGIQMSCNSLLTTVVSSYWWKVWLVDGEWLFKMMVSNMQFFSHISIPQIFRQIDECFNWAHLSSLRLS